LLAAAPDSSEFRLTKPTDSFLLCIAQRRVKSLKTMFLVEMDGSFASAYQNMYVTLLKLTDNGE
jgi:hypothetical protein